MSWGYDATAALPALNYNPAYSPAATNANLDFVNQQQQQALSPQTLYGPGGFGALTNYYSQLAANQLSGLTPNAFNMSNAGTGMTMGEIAQQPMGSVFDTGTTPYQSFGAAGSPYGGGGFGGGAAQPSAFDTGTQAFQGYGAGGSPFGGGGFGGGPDPLSYQSLYGGSGGLFQGGFPNAGGYQTPSSQALLGYDPNAGPSARGFLPPAALLALGQGGGSFQNAFGDIGQSPSMGRGFGGLGNFGAGGGGGGGGGGLSPLNTDQLYGFGGAPGGGFAAPTAHDPATSPYATMPDPQRMLGYTPDLALNTSQMQRLLQQIDRTTAATDRGMDPRYWADTIGGGNLPPELGQDSAHDYSPSVFGGGRDPNALSQPFELSSGRDRVYGFGGAPGAGEGLSPQDLQIPFGGGFGGGREAGALPFNTTTRGTGARDMLEAYPDLPSGMFTGKFARPESNDLYGRGYPAGLVQRFEDLPDLTPPAPGWGDWLGNIGKQLSNPFISPAGGAELFRDSNFNTGLVGSRSSAFGFDPSGFGEGGNGNAFAPAQTPEQAFDPAAFQSPANNYDTFQGGSFQPYTFGRPQGDAVAEAVNRTYSVAGMSPAQWAAIAQIESSMNPESNRTQATQYKGLYQLGIGTGDSTEWRDWGMGDIYNPIDNANTAARIFQSNAEWFQNRYGRDPTPGEAYLMHNQGRGFFTNGTMTNIAGNSKPGFTPANQATTATFLADYERYIADKAKGLMK